MVWIALGAAVVWVTILRERLHTLARQIVHLESLINLRARDQKEEFQDFLTKTENELAQIREHVGYEEYLRFLDDAVITNDKYRRLGSIFPRLSELEFELECHQREMKEYLLINGLKHPIEFPRADRNRILKQIKEEKWRHTS